MSIKEFISGWGDRQRATFEFWKNRVVAAADSDDPALPAKKQFTAKFNLPEITDYRNTACDKFWKAFPVNHLKTGTSPVSATRLRSWANAIGCTDRERLETVCKDLENGANIGCVGAAREATVCGYAPSGYDCGAEVTDAVADWVQQGVAAGPLNQKDRPTDAKSAASCAA